MRIAGRTSGGGNGHRTWGAGGLQPRARQALRLGKDGEGCCGGIQELERKKRLECGSVCRVRVYSLCVKVTGASEGYECLRLSCRSLCR